MPRHYGQQSLQTCSLKPTRAQKRQSTNARKAVPSTPYHGSIDPSYWLFPFAFSHPSIRIFGNRPFSSCPGLKIISSEALAPWSGVKSAISPPPRSVFNHLCPKLSVTNLLACYGEEGKGHRRMETGTYARTECHEREALFFVVERVLHCQGVHGCFRDLVGGRGKVVRSARQSDGAQSG